MSTRNPNKLYLTPFTDKKGLKIPPPYVLNDKDKLKTNDEKRIRKFLKYKLNNIYSFDALTKDEKTLIQKYFGEKLLEDSKYKIKTRMLLKITFRIVFVLAIIGYIYLAHELIFDIYKSFYDAYGVWYLVGWFGGSILVAAYGVNRRIGFFWALFISLNWSPLIGFIASAISSNKKKLQDNIDKKHNKEVQAIRFQYNQQEIKKQQSTSISGELQKLNKMKEDGLLSEEEFTKAKQKLIG